MSDDGQTVNDGGLRPLYAVSLQAIRTSDDLQAMRNLAAEARSLGSEDPDIQSALAELEEEIARQSNS